MKTLLATLMTLAVTFPVAADPLKVVTTIPDFASITKEVGGDEVEVTAMSRGFQDPHFVEPKPSFLLDLKKADLLEVVGLDLEIGWLPALMTQSRNSQIQRGSRGYLDLSSGVEILGRPTGPVDRSMGDLHAMGNPHYWIEPGNAIRIAAQIRTKLIELRPEKTEYFESRYLDFKRRVNEKHKEWMGIMEPHKNAKVVTYHNSWPNFAKRYDLDVVDYVEPKPGVPPSPSHIFDLIQTMKRENVKVIMVEPYFDRKTPNSIAEKAGAQVIVMYPSVGGAKGLDDWFAVFDRNIRTLAEALR